jgi:hypothetical protein
MARYLDVCRFGVVSLSRLDTCTPALQRLMKEAIRRAPKWLDFAIECGHRGEAEQNAAFARGTSKKRWPDGEHNSLPSRALDIRPAAPFSAEDWNDRVRFARIVGFIEGVAADLGIPIRVGLDWDRDGRSIDESFVDVGHIEDESELRHAA